MSRVEHQDAIKEEIIRSRETLSREIGTSPKHKLRGCCLSVLICVLGFFLLAFFAAFTVARTGLVDVPAVSGWAFRAPEPTRIVRSGMPLEIFLSNKLIPEVMKQLDIQRPLAGQTFTAAISEDVLTRALQDVGQRASLEPLILSRGQVAITDKGFELFVPVRGQKEETVVSAVIRLAMDEKNALDVQIRRASVGRVRIPGFLLHWFVEPAIEKPLREALGEAASWMRIVDVQTNAGFALVKSELSNSFTISNLYSLTR